MTKDLLSQLDRPIRVAIESARITRLVRIMKDAGHSEDDIRDIIAVIYDVDHVRASSLIAEAKEFASCV